LLTGTGIVVVIYLALNMVYVYAMPLEEFPSQALRIGDVAVERLFGPGAVWCCRSQPLQPRTC